MNRRPQLAGGTLLALAFIAVFAVIRPSAATEIWLSATEPQWRSAHNWPPNDYMRLFELDAPWEQAAADVKVFELSKRFVVDSPADSLSAVIKDLQRRGIMLSVQATPLVATPQCGVGAEGHGPPSDMVEMANKLRKLGATLAYLRMDEPLWYGHRWDGAPGVVACHMSIEEVARQAASKFKAVRRIYPMVTIGDIEPIGVPSAYASDWSHEIEQWVHAFQIAMGEPLGFLHADMVWSRPTWPVVLKQVVDLLHVNKIPLGIIYNGVPNDRSDAAWIDDAEGHFRLVEGVMNIRPDQAIFQSWMDFPRTILPDREPQSLTNLVLRYAAWQQKLHPGTPGSR